MRKKKTLTKKNKLRLKSAQQKFHSGKVISEVQGEYLGTFVDKTWVWVLGEKSKKKGKKKRASKRRVTFSRSWQRNHTQGTTPSLKKKKSGANQSQSKKKEGARLINIKR